MDIFPNLLNYNIFCSALGNGCDAGIREWDFQIPRTFLRFWQPLLKSLHSREFTQSLLEKMFAELQPCAQNLEHRSRYLINWITEILKATMKASEYHLEYCKVVDGTSHTHTHVLIF